MRPLAVLKSPKNTSNSAPERDMDNECKAELCPMWGGDACLCDVFGIDPGNPPCNGTFSVIVPDNE